jgi:rhodanese-related sulfurtransferase
MPQLAISLAGLALITALAAYVRAGRGSNVDEVASREARRVSGNLERELRAEIELTRRLMAEVVRGIPLSPEAILDGQLWRDVDGAVALELVEKGGVTVIDVRMALETASGMLPGAKLIPMDELDDRKEEIPKDRTVLVYCASGGRSAAACDALAREGWSGLMNLTGGIGAWQGAVVKP